MTDDRSLLEAAARAAGATYTGWHEHGLLVSWPGMTIASAMLWNPLEHDGDALRLAVQCGIEVSIIDDEPGNDGRTSRACAGYATEAAPRMRYVFEDHKGDLFSATRRAIVRAAAEIGRAS